MAVVIAVASSSCEEESPVLPAVESIVISPERLTLKVGETKILHATVIPAEARVVWSSSNSSIVAVNDGTVHAGAIKGTAVITAQSGDKKAACSVTVVEEEEATYPLCHEVKVNIGIRTITTYPSDKDPAPKDESYVQISGTVVGTAVTGRIEKIVSNADYWAGLAQYGSVPVFTGSSDYKIRDENDYSNVLFHSRGPLQVNVQRSEMDYVSFNEGGKMVEKYIKVYDFLSAGKNEMEAISLVIEPYFPSTAIPPLIPHYVLDLNILTYTEFLGQKILGNGHSLRWNYTSESLEPTGDELYMGIAGRKTETDPGEGVTSPLVQRDMLNNYFMDASAAGLSLSLSGSSYRENSGVKTQRTIMIKLEFRSVPTILALPSISMPPPPLEDWDWE